MEHNIVSVSGGKDSTALLLLAMERQPENLEAVFADTGNEHQITYDYVRYLNDEVFPIRTVRADFARQIAGKREYVLTKWAGRVCHRRPLIVLRLRLFLRETLSLTCASGREGSLLPRLRFALRN